MHRTIESHPHHLRYTARIVAVRLVDLNTDHRQARFGKNAVKPLRQRSGFQPNLPPYGCRQSERVSGLRALPNAKRRGIENGHGQTAWRIAMAAQWHLSGDYFENCNCSVVCPCLVSKAPPLTSRPTEGVCDVGVIFHIENGRYGDVTLDGLNVALAIHTPGPMGEGNWAVGAYIDERADAKQTEALGAIFTGTAGGPMAAFAPLISKNLGMKKVPITYRVDGKKRSAEIPNILHMSVDPLPTMHPSGEMWANSGHPISPDKLAFAVGAPGNTFSDHGMRWDNSGKNGHYAPIRWSNQS